MNLKKKVILNPTTHYDSDFFFFLEAFGGIVGVRIQGLAHAISLAQPPSWSQFFYQKIKKKVYVCMCLCVCHIRTGAREGQEVVLAPLALESRQL